MANQGGKCGRLDFVTSVLGANFNIGRVPWQIIAQTATVETKCWFKVGGP